MLTRYLKPRWADPFRAREEPICRPTLHPGPLSPIVLKFARRHRHGLMMGAAAGAVLVSMGAFALLPPVKAIQYRPPKIGCRLAQNTSRRARD